MIKYREHVTSPKHAPQEVTTMKVHKFDPIANISQVQFSIKKIKHNLRPSMNP